VPAGRGRVVRELLEALAGLENEHRFLLYCRRPADGLPLDARFEWREVAARDPLWHVATAARASRACDVFFSTNSYLTAWFLRVPTAVEVYDLIPFRPGARAQRRAQVIEKLTIRPGLARAKALVCISEATRADLVELFPRSAGKAVVVTLAANQGFRRRRSAEELEEVRSRHGLDRPFVLCTGTLEPRKNLVQLIDAYAGLPADLRERHRLVLVGPKGWEADEINRRISATDVTLLGYVSDDDLAALYQSCAVFCYPSLYEGFGLPVLEAMTSGAPVLASRIASLTEVAGDAARYVDPLDAASIRAGLEGLLGSSDEERARLAALGQERAASFSWEKTARETLAVLESLS
jgi:glycosyltransferase involved in cell wall biosynthesis